MAEPRITLEDLGLPPEIATPANPYAGPLDESLIVEPDTGQPTEQDITALLTIDDAARGADVLRDEPYDFDSNLAGLLSEADRGSLAMSVCDWVRRDKGSRKDWERREASGIRALGVTEEIEGGMPGGSTAVHPGLTKACIEFWARAYGELDQGGSPAKAVVLGESSPQMEARAKRVEGYLNYLYKEEMPGARAELSRMLYRLPLSGSVFRVAYFDPIERTIAVKFVESQDLVKPYSAVELREAPRFTRIVRMSRNDLRRMVAEGRYLDVIKSDPQPESMRHGVIERAIDDATGRQPTAEGGLHEAEKDQRDELYECRCYLNLTDYGWDDPLGEDWGVPYVATVHSSEQKLLELRRDWRRDDEIKRRRLTTIEYKFLPGLEGYGFGLLHIASGLSAAQTGFLRYLLDACALDTAGRTSGFVSQNLAGRGEIKFEIGKFQTMVGSAEDWQKQIWTPDFKYSANNTLETIQYLDQLLSFLVASTEILIGEDSKNIPVGTQLARIEQGLKPFTTIFSLLHDSFTQELRAVAELAFDYMPDYYPYAVAGGAQDVLRSDFDPAVIDVIPTSDPNVVTATQRIAQAQAVLEVVKGDPEVFGPMQRLSAYANLFEVLRVQNYERFLPAPDQFMQQMAMQQAQAQMPDPRAQAVEADIQRKDAIAQADMQRKNAITQAQIDRDAERMRIDAERQRQGDEAIQAQEAQAELSDAQREILQAAMARRQNLAEQMAPVPA